MTSEVSGSPFHEGEKRVQSRLGVREQAELLGKRFVRNYLPGQHREFYAQLPYLFAGSVDESGRPWASILCGRPGFLSSPDENTLKIQARPIYCDPLIRNLKRGRQLGLLGIEYHSRRRNRATGKISRINDEEIVIHIDQAFGNCPSFIQNRKYELLREIDNVGEAKPCVELTEFNTHARNIISRADCFYIATQYSDTPGDARQGADISHRGGKPGFVKIVDEKTLLFPDFQGNNHFNTLGNIELNPVAGVLFTDFDSGDLLYLTGKAEVIWDSADLKFFEGAQRFVKLTLDEGRLVKQAMPFRWAFKNYSPALEMTGTWQANEENLPGSGSDTRLQDYNVVRVEKESDVIKSFYLVPADGSRIQHYRAGQFLPIEISLPGQAEPLRRTYTISNSPNGEYYRLSIKREPARHPGMPPGLSSNYFHDQVTTGSTIRALPPQGKFVLDKGSSRSVVLLSGGVGITPLLSMLQQLRDEAEHGGSRRKVWFIHAARNSSVQAFRQYLQDAERKWQELRVVTVYSDPLENDRKGEHYDNEGLVDIDLLKRLLPLDDYEFYYCGPPPFMDGLYKGLKSLNIADQRIHYEFFGPATTPIQDAAPPPPTGTEDQAGVAVKFEKSGLESVWLPEKGTLLELAEQAGLTPDYGCRSGVCQTCATKVLSGDVAYGETPVVNTAEGEALICSATPRPGNEDTQPLVLDL